MFLFFYYRPIITFRKKKKRCKRTEYELSMQQKTVYSQLQYTKKTKKTKHWSVTDQHPRHPQHHVSGQDQATYTDQNYKRNTFVFAPIFHELNSKI